MGRETGLQQLPDHVDSVIFQSSMLLHQGINETGNMASLADDVDILLDETTQGLGQGEASSAEGECCGGVNIAEEYYNEDYLDDVSKGFMEARGGLQREFRRAHAP